MKYKSVIQQPVFYGCGTYSNVIDTILCKDLFLESNGVHFVTLNGKDIDGVKVGDLKAKDGSLLEIITPLYEEEYQLQNNNWVLVGQGEGYA